MSAMLASSFIIISSIFNTWLVISADFCIKRLVFKTARHLLATITRFASQQTLLEFHHALRSSDDGLLIET